MYGTGREDFGLSYPLFDDDDSLAIVNEFGVVYLPHNVILDHNMIVQYAESGSFDEESVVETIEDLLSGLPTAGTDGPDVGRSPEVPSAVRLHPAFPNPFNASTTIGYTLPRDSRVRLDVFDAGGRHVRVLEDGVWKAAGRHEVNWHPVTEGSGIYVIRLESSQAVRTRKLLYIK